MPNHYQYRAVSGNKTIEDFQQELNRLGALGWRVISSSISASGLPFALMESAQPPSELAATE